MTYKRASLGLREFYVALLAFLSLFWLTFGGAGEGTFGKSNFTRDVYRVKSCSDGDTCTLFSVQQEKLKVRLIGIDAPEVRHGGKQVGQPFGDEATKFLNGLVRDKEVTLVSYGQDPYRRTLAEIFVGDTNVNVEMVSNGFAEVYRGKAKSGVDMSRYRRAEDAARSQKVGMWALPLRESPFEYRQKLRTQGQK